MKFNVGTCGLRIREYVLMVRVDMIIFSSILTNFFSHVLEEGLRTFLWMKG